MWEWIQGHVAVILICAVLAAIVVLIIRGLVRDRKSLRRNGSTIRSEAFRHMRSTGKKPISFRDGLLALSAVRYLSSAERFSSRSTS